MKLPFSWWTCGSIWQSSESLESTAHLLTLFCFQLKSIEYSSFSGFSPTPSCGFNSTWCHFANCWTGSADTQCWRKSTSVLPHGHWWFPHGSRLGACCHQVLSVAVAYKTPPKTSASATCKEGWVSGICTGYIRASNPVWQRQWEECRSWIAKWNKTN